LYIIITSLVNFASVSNLEIEDDSEFQGSYVFSLLLGTTTFLASAIILIADRFQYCCNSSSSSNSSSNANDTKDNNNSSSGGCSCKMLNYTKSLDGKLEGCTLVTFTIWWIIGVAHTTQVDGVAYVVTNIYFSSWMALVACVYTLERWSAAKDIISIQELTGLSATLKSWYLLFLASLVTMGTSCDLLTYVADQHRDSATIGVILGLASTLVSLFFILVHYRIVDFDFIHVGGWLELSASFLMILVWVIGVSILTAEGGVAATIGGSGCRSRTEYEDSVDFGEGCYVIWVPVSPPSMQPSSQEEVANVTDAPSSNTTTSLPTEAATATSQPTTLEAENSTNTNMPSSSGTNSPGPTQLPETTAPTDSDNRPASTAPGVSSTVNATGAPTIATSTLSPTDATTTMASSEAIITSVPSKEISTILPSDTVVEQENITFSPTADSLYVSDIFFEVEPNEIGNNGQQRRLQETPVEFLLFLNETNATDNTTGNDNSTISANTTSSSPSYVPSYFPSALPTAVPTSVPTLLEYDQRMSCADVIDQQVPGSNLYLAVWVCLFASFNVALRWKAAQAIQFAQAPHKKAANSIREEEEDRGDSENDDDDENSNQDDEIGDDERDPTASHRVEDDDL